MPLTGAHLRRLGVRDPERASALLAGLPGPAGGLGDLLGVLEEPAQQPGEHCGVVGKGPAGAGGAHDLGGQGPLGGDDRFAASEVLVELDRGGELPIRVRLDEQDAQVGALVEGGELLPGTVHDLDPAAGGLHQVGVLVAGRLPLVGAGADGQAGAGHVDDGAQALLEPVVATQPADVEQVELAVGTGGGRLVNDLAARGQRGHAILGEPGDVGAHAHRGQVEAVDVARVPGQVIAVDASHGRGQRGPDPLAVVGEGPVDVPVEQGRGYAMPVHQPHERRVDEGVGREVARLSQHGGDGRALGVEELDALPSLEAVPQGAQATRSLPGRAGHVQHGVTELPEGVEHAHRPDTGRRRRLPIQGERGVVDDRSHTVPRLL